MATTTSSGKKRKVSAPTIFSSGINNSSNSNSSNNSSNAETAAKTNPVHPFTTTPGNPIGDYKPNINTNMDRSETDTTETANKYIERLQQSDRAAASQQNTNNNFKRISSVEKRTTGRGGTEVKISFGPSRPPSSGSGSGAGGNGGGSGGSGGKTKHRNSHNSSSSSSNSHNSSNSNSNSNSYIHGHHPASVAAAANVAAMMGGAAGGSCGSVSFGDLDLEALKEKAAAAAAGQKTFRNKHGLPCTEAEMKALMSMFVEIMGMSMNNNNSNNNNNNNNTHTHTHSHNNGNGGNANANASGSNSGNVHGNDSKRGSGSGSGSSNKNNNNGNGNGGGNGGGGGGGGPVFSFGANPMDASSLAAMAAAASGCGSSPSGMPMTMPMPMLPDHMAAATAGFFADGASWETLRRTYAAAEQMAAAEHDEDEDDCDEDDEDDDEESFENRELTFEEVEFLLHHRKQKEEAAKLASQFASGDWESLEQVAINDHLLSSEADDRERKAAKKREKKQRRKAKLKEEAAQKAAEAARKKREKAIVSWRSRVVSACQSNEITKLDGLLQESPLRKLMEEESNTNSNSNTNTNSRKNTNYDGHGNGNDGHDPSGSSLSTSSSCIIPHLEFFLPNSVAKNRAHVERGIEARLRLAEYVLHSELLLAFKPLRTGRTALHTACFHGDVRFLQLLFDKVEMYEPTDGKDPLPSSFLDLTCDESGWSPLHYAALSGSPEVLELLLAKGSNLSILTDVTHTWRESDGRGLTPRELVQCIQAGNYEQIIETHGLALQEMTNAFFNHHQERKVFLKKLERVHHRLSNVEKNGYAPITSKDRADSMTESDVPTADATLNPSETSSSRNKKKKKKKKKQNGKDAESGKAGTAASNPNNSASAQSNATEVEQKEDPLVTALLGMGFNESQIMSAVKACGGTHRATADDLVTWILGQGENEESTNETPKHSDSSEGQRRENVPNNDQLWTEESMPSNPKDQKQQEVEAARKQEETARRLATKREEARRRNREWNNREQARQEKEAKAKVAQKAYHVARPLVPVPITQTQTRLPNGLHKAAPATGSPISRLKGSARQPKLPTGTAGNKWGVPTITNSKNFPAPNMQSKNSAPKATSTAATEQQAVPISRIFTSMDDDKTVSSFGSNRGISVSSKEFAPVAPVAPQPSVPPPGFSPSLSQPIITAPVKPPAISVPEESRGDPFLVGTRQGEIRATAKAFVPSFTIPGIVDADSPLEKEFGPSTEPSASQNSESHGVVFPPGILPQPGGSTVGHSSLLGSSLTNSLDNNAPSMAAAGGSILPGTAFVSGSNMNININRDEPPVGISFGFGQGDSKDSHDIGGSRLLNSISRNRSAGTTSIWGDSQGIPSLETTLQPSFFGDGNLHDSDDKKSSLWDVPTVGNSSLPNGQGSIW